MLQYVDCNLEDIECESELTECWKTSTSPSVTEY